MRRFALLMTLALRFAGPVLALQQPAPGQRDARVRMVTYDPANVVRLNGVIRASTQVVFADDEEVAHVAIGDAVAWEVAPAGSILFLKPREKHPPTNLQIVHHPPRRPALVPIRVVDRGDDACGQLLRRPLRLSR